jgi:hypothetical protein
MGEIMLTGENQSTEKEIRRYADWFVNYVQLKVSVIVGHVTWWYVNVFLEICTDRNTVGLY